MRFALPRIVWHPEQGLWNRELVRAMNRGIRNGRMRAVALRTLVLADTVRISLRAGRERLLVPRCGAGTDSVPFVKTPVLYIDVGTHEDGQELAWMAQNVLPALCRSFRAVGFEASPEFYASVAERHAGERSVSIVHAALTSRRPASGSILLYRGAGRGLGSTTQGGTGNGVAEKVPALRLSDWLADEKLDLDTTVCILRMNIEGAEVEVVRDLIEHGLIGKIDGFFGMWDDVAKAGVEDVQCFRGLLRAHGIRPFTFNARDLRYPLRRAVIAYHVRTCLERGQRRISSGRERAARCD